MDNSFREIFHFELLSISVSGSEVEFLRHRTEHSRSGRGESGSRRRNSQSWM